MRDRLVVLAVLAACGDNDTIVVLPEVTDPVAHVDPRIGTGGNGFAHGSCFVGAAMPHGLVKLGPDTSGPFGAVSFLHFSGYWAGDDKIRGFSHLHLHGTGATDYGVLSVMPVLAFDPSKRTVVDYETKFAKADEHAAAGRYEVTLANGIGVELAATERVGLHRYRFSGNGAVVIDLGKTLDGGTVDAASITVDTAAREITGQFHHTGGMSGRFGGYTVYFVARAVNPWTGFQTWSASAPPSTAPSASGTGVGAVLDVSGTFDLAVGISLVSLDGARKNLDAEVPVLDFETTAARARDAWTKLLGRVLITGGTEAERRIFYTSLYHSFLMPSVIADVDGTYVLEGGTPAVASWRQMSDLSLWDTYRTTHPLYAWLAPDTARDAARSLVAFGQGLGIFPKWPLATGETGSMIGASAEIAIADAVLRGVPGVDAELAWTGLRAAAMDTTPPAAGRGGRNHVEPYMLHGFVPNTIGNSVSLTTEYAHDDFALANLAGALGHTAERDALLTRSRGWRALYDPAVGFLRGKNPDGNFPATAFDPLELGSDYEEANAWHSLWMTGAHDAAGLAELHGGADPAIAKLEMFFELAKEDWDEGDEAAANFPRPYYWHGNEPDINSVFVFAQLGRHDLTARWVRWIEETHYTDGPEGVAGNDDGGTLGAWYVLATLGVYPVPGSDRWILGAPRFPQARVVVGGRELVIVADGLSQRAIYVQAVELDGVPVETPELAHTQLAGASTLRFVMGTSPSAWGR
jgi:predicted alpha-1,2-mannosidase